MTAVEQDVSLNWSFGNPAAVWAPTEWTPAPEGVSVDYSLSAQVVDFVNAILPASPDHPGATLDDWQAWAIGEALSRVPSLDDDGQPIVDAEGNVVWQPRFRAYAIITPRQSGKSLVGSGLTAASLFLGGPTALTVNVASSLAQASIIASRVRNLIAANPALEARTKRSTATRGITLRSGAQSVMLAATSKALNGYPMTGITSIIDEAHLLQPAVLSQMLIGASTTDCVLTILTTAGDETSEMLKTFIDDCRKGIPSYGMCYWHAKDGLTIDDPDWREQIVSATPGILSGRLDKRRVLEECERLPVADFRRYRANTFVSAADSIEGAFPGTSWRDLDRLTENDRPPTGSMLCAALDVANDRSAASLAVAWRLNDGRPAVSIVGSLVQPDTEDIAKLILDTITSIGFNLWHLGIDFLRLGDVQDYLDAAGVVNWTANVQRLGLRDQVMAAALLRKAVVEGSIVVDANPALDVIAGSIVMKPVARNVGLDATPFRFIKKVSDGPSIDPLIAIAAAHALLEGMPNDSTRFQVF